jgi:uncharacterized protein
MGKEIAFWFDLETAPDVLFFQPIAKQILSMSYKVYITYRDYSDVPNLVNIYGLQGDRVGWHAGKNKFMKVAVGLTRSLLLTRWARGKKISVAVGFGSRPLAVACGLLRIPNASVFDYEHVSIGALNRFCDWIFIPEEVSINNLVKRGTPAKKVIKYIGLKEEVYAGSYRYDKGLLQCLGYDEKKVIVTIRPPATKAHYHDQVSEIICRSVLQKIASDTSIIAIFLRRDNDPSFDKFFRYDNIKKLTQPVKGLDLIAISDLVISGGGTMVREAVGLGVPAYSIFTGKQGAVDERLASEGRLVLIRKPEDVNKIKLQKRDYENFISQNNTSVLDFFVGEFIKLAEGMR